MPMPFLVAGFMATLAGSPLPPSNTVLLRGETGQSVILTAADIASAPRATVRLTHGDRTTVFEGARLDGLLTRVSAPLGPALRGAAMADVIMATAADGYRVALALAEVDPGLSPSTIILADREDGAALTSDGPFRLVVGGDLRPARSARSVMEIDVRRLP